MLLGTELWLGMDALETVCIGTQMTSGFGIDALLIALETRALGEELWFGHGCSGKRMLSEHNGIMVWAWTLWQLYTLGTRTKW